MGGQRHQVQHKGRKCNGRDQNLNQGPLNLQPGALSTEVSGHRRSNPADRYIAKEILPIWNILEECSTTARHSPLYKQDAICTAQPKTYHTK
jgi:hypothetical protein